MPEDIQSRTGGGDRFRAEFLLLWQSLPHKELFVSLLLVWIALFLFLGNSTFGYMDTASLFRWMYNSYNVKDSEDQFGDLVPFVVLYLMWGKRKALLNVPKSIWWPAMLGLGGACLLHIMGYVVQQPRLSIIAFFAGVYFLMGLAWGRAWLRASFFPYILFVFCVPLGSLAESLTFPLRLVATQVSVGLSQSILGIDVARDGTRMVINGSLYEVAVACSGIRSLIALTAITFIYSMVSFHTVWKRLLLVFLAVPLALGDNIMRLISLIIMADGFGEGTAMWVHDNLAGYVMFAAAIIVIMLVGNWLREERPADWQPETV